MRSFLMVMCAAGVFPSPMAAPADEQSVKTAEEILQAYVADFRHDPAAAQAITFGVRVTGEGGGDWVVTIKDRTCTVTEGETTSADATVRMDAGDYVALATGKLSRMKAFTSGRIKASGDLSLLQRMDRWFVPGG